MSERGVATATDMIGSGSTQPRHYEDSGICYSDAPRICDTHKLRSRGLSSKEAVL
jgi:hypothetical protein